MLPRPHPESESPSRNWLTPRLLLLLQPQERRELDPSSLPPRNPRQRSPLPRSQRLRLPRSQLLRRLLPRRSQLQRNPQQRSQLRRLHPRRSKSFISSSLLTKRPFLRPPIIFKEDIYFLNKLELLVCT